MPAETPGGTMELLVALKAVAPFASLPPEDLALLVDLSTPRSFGPIEDRNQAEPAVPKR